MSGFKMNEWIARPPQEVFDFVTDSQNAPKIVSSVKSMVKLTEGPVRVGTHFRETRLMNGKEHEADLEVVEYDLPRRYDVKNITEGFEVVYRYHFQPERNGTQVDLVCDVTASGLKKLMRPLVVAALRREDGGHLQMLKKTMES